MIGLDRCERGTGQHSAVEEAEQSLSRAKVLFMLHDIINWLETQEDSAESLADERVPRGFRCLRTFNYCHCCPRSRSRRKLVSHKNEAGGTVVDWQVPVEFIAKGRGAG